MSIKLLICDIDGVLTNGFKMYDNNAKCIAKSFGDKEWTGLKKFIASGVKVILLTGDANINLAVAKNRNIECICTHKQDKLLFLQDILDKEEVNIDETVYIGDDIFDLSILSKVRISCCPSDSAPEVLDRCVYISSNPGGGGVVSDVYNHLVRNNEIEAYSIDRLLMVDRNETM